MPIPLKEVRRIEMSNSSSRGLIPFRFGRAMFDANPEMVGGVMASCAKLVDSGIIKSTATTKFKEFDGDQGKPSRFKCLARHERNRAKGE